MVAQAAGPTRRSATAALAAAMIHAGAGQAEAVPVPAISLDLEGAGAIFRLHAAAAPCAIQETGCSGGCCSDMVLAFLVFFSPDYVHVQCSEILVDVNESERKEAPCMVRFRFR
jgi:hypothetical protein